MTSLSPMTGTETQDDIRLAAVLTEKAAVAIMDRIDLSVGDRLKLKEELHRRSEDLKKQVGSFAPHR